MLASGTITLEMSVTLDTHPDLRHWAWYSGALQQYHTAFLLLLEVGFLFPVREPLKLNRVSNRSMFILRVEKRIEFGLV